ncbi:o-succinylbenzoate synthase [Arcanobacterium hippocoleae]|uniref:o-succinylbenzoate synthase n=1 Tax=Arcanobacterium hippocoleae TaxID=149017 RepID=UPI003342B73D
MPSVFRALRAESGQIKAYIFELPMRVKFRGITMREGVLLQGPAGWAEFSPFWDYRTAESARWLMGGLDSVLRGYPLSAQQRREIPINVTVPAVPAPQAAEIAQALGAHTAKVKVAEPGQTIQDDLSRLAAVRAALGAKANIRIDVNGKWDLRTACDNLPKYDRAARGLEYAEQPCADVADLARLRKRIPSVQIAADESLRRAENPLLVRDLAAADVVVVKNQPLLGVRAALELVTELDLPAVVSSALESSVGLTSGLYLAAALPDLRYACGLGTAKLFHIDVSSQALLARAGVLPVRKVDPDFLLDAYHRDGYCMAELKNGESRRQEVSAPRAETFSNGKNDCMKHGNFARLKDGCMKNFWCSSFVRSTCAKSEFGF